MDRTQEATGGIFSLPNEILLRIFDLLDSRQVVSLTPICHHFHRLALRLLHSRLQTAAGLAGHTLYMECHHPAARTPAGKMFCAPSDTDGLNELLDGIHDDASYIGLVKQAFAMYSRFKPQRRGPSVATRTYVIPGDIPGSRTHPSSNPALASFNPNDAVSLNITIDAHEIFSQLSALAYLGRGRIERGLMLSIQQVSEGYIRIWRPWLSAQCESKSWTDGEPIAVHQDLPNSSAAAHRDRADSVTSLMHPAKDPSILWVDSRDENVGIKFRVKERLWKRNAPVPQSADVESAVSYVVEIEEVFIRTSHLVLKIEEADDNLTNQTSKVIVFGSYR